MYPIGTERLYNGYVEVKVSRSKWRWKHHLIWEQAHGPVPDGHLICFADGDTRNFSLDNLISISRSDFVYQRTLKTRRAKFPIGAEKNDSHGYIHVKVAEPHAWRPKHYLIWEAAHGPIPADHQVYFIDGNRRNFRLANLAARPKSPPIGAEQVASSGYIMVKIAEPNVWRLKHRLVWETANGPIPEGHTLCFTDKNPRNCALDNLALITNQELGYMVRENLFRAAIGPELFKTAVNLAKLGLATKKRVKEIKIRR